MRRLENRITQISDPAAPPPKGGSSQLFLFFFAIIRPKQSLSSWLESVTGAKNKMKERETVITGPFPNRIDLATSSETLVYTQEEKKKKKLGWKIIKAACLLARKRYIHLKRCIKHKHFYFLFSLLSWYKPIWRSADMPWDVEQFFQLKISTNNLFSVLMNPINHVIDSFLLILFI